MLRFFTDPHLGRNATSHTTPESRKKLDKALAESALSITYTDQPILCLGDLFHSAHNSESTIAMGFLIAEQCELVLEGNHDLPNRANTTSSIGLLAMSLDEDTTRFAACGVGNSNIVVKVIQGVKCVAVPHHSSQDLFDSALKMAEAEGGELLLLHCNYNTPFNEGIETSLNLSEAQAIELAKHFDYIVIGHEHNHRWELDRKVLLLGNTHPTSFADISDKYYWDYDPSDKSWHKHMLWRKDTHYLKLRLEDVLDGNYQIKPEHRFIDIVGRVECSEESYQLSTCIQHIWESHDYLFMVRNHTIRMNLAEELGDGLVSEIQDGVSGNLKEVIHNMVKGTHMEEVFLNYVKDSEDD
ncbi:metallophosphoesterase [Vibrio parahaemolyticus]|nr:metallophosphoesterase [Vibrio parahaemolyticus]